MMLQLDIPGVVLYPSLFLLGSVFGSFANVCIYRLPTRYRLIDQIRGLWKPPSQCPRCKKLIGVYNIPVFGWLILRGRCKNCKMWISPRYPLIEAFTGCLWVLVFWLEVPTAYFSQLENSCVYCNLGRKPFRDWDRSRRKCLCCYGSCIT